MLLWVLIALGAAVFLFANRPLHMGTLLGCAAVCLLILFVLSLLERPTTSVPVEPPADEPA